MHRISTPKLSDYQYDLPEEYIAKFPLEARDASRLLHYENGNIAHHHFYELPSLLPKNSLLVFNNTKVIPARLIFQKATGARIEIFLLKPVLPSPLIQLAMESTGPVTWECMIGNLKRWKEGEVLSGQIDHQGQAITINATLKDKIKKEVTLDWSAENITFASVVESSGEVPLPPYLNREATEMDRPRYQTVYSKIKGAVAAPTAGLHFTDKLLNELADVGVTTDYLTLHVGAGTFQPIKDEEVVHHPMHSEQMVFTRDNLETLLAAQGNSVAVGTTSMRSLESLYWYGVKILQGAGEDFFIEKLFPYRGFENLPSKHESLSAVLTYMKKHRKNEITGHTEIFIFPGYHFRVCNGLITNFHQPGSTLILLVAAFTHNNWKKIYSQALANKYRFLSYGDSSMLWNNKL
ncbi:S-adenosylmethionine:tRNA ribosyltransferase-isomerase [Negadavirga shengliensis]|uniref:S-adenosylmethionine:tRNA ribosyltransferase-isomerase n=1 Tax=Negadavirga shengliensis TaxID=1389218 RepID=A0ABV9T711_9BACT